MHSSKNTTNRLFRPKTKEIQPAKRRPIAAAVEMSREWKETTGKDWKPGAIQARFSRLTNTKCMSYQKPEDEPCDYDEHYSTYEFR